MSRITKNLSELQFFVNLLEDMHGKKKYSDYELLVQDLLIEFGIISTRKELIELFEPTEDEIRRDLVIQMNNVS